MWKLGAEFPAGLLMRRAASLSGSHFPKFLLKFACRFWQFRRLHINRTPIFCYKSPANASNTIHVCGNEHKCVINPFMNHVLHLGRRLTFCSFSSVCALFIIVSILAEAVQNEDVDGWFLFARARLASEISFADSSTRVTQAPHKRQLGAAWMGQLTCS